MSFPLWGKNQNALHHSESQMTVSMIVQAKGTVSGFLFLNDV